MRPPISTTNFHQVHTQHIKEKKDSEEEGGG
jgi:hypothetical protein